MATVSASRLVCKFESTEGDTLTKRFSHAKASVTGAQAKALMTSLIQYGDVVFNKAPATAISAQVVTTTTTDLDIA